MTTHRHPFTSLLGLTLLCAVSLTASATPAHAGGAPAHAGDARAARDAKKDTRVVTFKSIHSNDTYGAMARCDDGEYEPILDGGLDCHIAGGQSMHLKVFTKTALGLPEETRIFQVTAHNHDSHYICDDLGFIERGYAATIAEIYLGDELMSIDVCTTVEAAGHDTTEARLEVTEGDDGLFVELINDGGSWEPTGQFPDRSGPIPVDFDRGVR